MYCTYESWLSVLVLRVRRGRDTVSVIPLSLHSRRRGGRCRVGRLCGFRASVHRGVRSGPLSTDYAPPLRGGSSGERTHAAELRGDVAAWGDVSKVSKCMLV